MHAHRLGVQTTERVHLRRSPGLVHVGSDAALSLHAEVERVAVELRPGLERGVDFPDDRAVLSDAEVRLGPGQVAGERGVADGDVRDEAVVSDHPPRVAAVDPLDGGAVEQGHGDLQGSGYGQGPRPWWGAGLVVGG